MQARFDERWKDSLYCYRKYRHLLEWLEIVSDNGQVWHIGQFI